MVHKKLVYHKVRRGQMLFCGLRSLWRPLKQKKEIIRSAFCEGHSGYRTEGRSQPGIQGPFGCWEQPQVREEMMAGQM